MEVASNAFYVQDADEVIFYFTAATDYDFSQLNWNRAIEPMKKCVDIQKKIESQPYEEIKERHIVEHGALFNRVTFNMGETSSLPVDERLRRLQKGKKICR